MQLTPQTFTDSTYAEAVSAGCDIVQIRYSGIWARIEISRGNVRIYDRKQTTLAAFCAPDDLVCTLVGNFIGPPWQPTPAITIWDCWSIGEVVPTSVNPLTVDIEHFTYRDRFAFVKQKSVHLDPVFTTVKNYPITKAPELWANMPEGSNGLVFRNSRDTLKGTVRLVRYYPTIPRALS